MKLIYMLFASVGFLTFVVSAVSLFFLWAYLLLRISGFLPASEERDASARKFGAFFGKLLLFSIAYAAVYLVVARAIGPPR